jgi:hypothetical protein
LDGNAADDGDPAGFESVRVGEFAATTTSKMAAEAPTTPGTQFCRCRQSNRMLNSHLWRGGRRAKTVPDGAREKSARTAITTAARRRETSRNRGVDENNPH